METFLICHRGALGDFILTWSALNYLRKVLPIHHFLGIGRTEYMRLAQRFDLLDDYRDMESKAACDFFNGKSFPPDLKPPKGAILWLTEGSNAARLLKKRASLPVITIKPFPKIRYHIARYYCLMVSRHFPLKMPDDLAIQVKIPNKKSREYALIHPGSGSVKKNYSTELSFNIADLLKRNGFAKVGFVLGPAELERNYRNAFHDQWVIKPEDVNQLADILSGASLYVGNDSGVSHLAATIGIPTITLYKSTDPKVWGTLGNNARHIIGEEDAVLLEKIKNVVTHPLTTPLT